MMTVEPTCRFCHQRLVWAFTHIPTIISTGPYAKDTVETFKCARCNSEQDFTEEGQPLSYYFYVGTYKLCFYSHNQTFQIKHYPQGRMGASSVVLELNHWPHNLTPKTVTVERIKTLILFS